MFQEQMDCLKYSDDLAMRAAIQIVDADHQQVLLVFGASRLKHAQEHLQNPQRKNHLKVGTKIFLSALHILST